MAWLRLDDGFAGRPAIVNLTDREFRLFIRLLCHCASTWLRQMIPCERLAGGPHRIEGISLAPAPVRRTRRPYDLDDPLLSLEQKRRQASAEAAGALDRP